MFYHFTMNCIWLMFFLHELKHVLALVKQFTSASSIETFPSSRYYSHGSSFSHLVVCKRKNLVKAFKFSKQSVHLARCETQDLYNTDTSDMNESRSWSLPSLKFLSAELTWLDMFIWLSLFNPCLHSGETRYNLNKWCFGLLNILNLLNKSNRKWLQCLNVLNRIRSDNFQKNVSGQQLAHP